MFKHLYAVIVSAGALAAVPAMAQVTRYVDAINGSDAGNTCSNDSVPCQTITHAIGVASSGDIIDIAEGLYTESFEIDKSLSLHGTGQSTTIVQAHAEPGQANSRVVGISGEIDVEITGLTIRHGRIVSGSGHGGGLYNVESNLTLKHVSFNHNLAGNRGGGMMNLAANATLDNVSFHNNQATQGGGLSNSGVSNSLSNPTLTNVSFHNNSASHSGGGMMNRSDSNPLLTQVHFSDNQAVFGGGMYNHSGEPTLAQVSFSGNSAAAHGGGMSNSASGLATLTDVSFDGNHVAGTESNDGGGGMYVGNHSIAVLTRVTFKNNSANLGGGMRIRDNGNAVIINVRFIDNTAVHGGGAHIEDRGPTIANTLFAGNMATGAGAGLFISDAGPTLTNVTLGGNLAQGFGGGLFVQGDSTVTLRNSIIWGNSGPSGANELFVSSSAEANLSHCLYANGSGDIFGDLNVDANSLTSDPLFVYTTNGNRRLAEGSPAIDSGNPDTNMGLFPGGPNSPVDLDNRPRLYGPEIDMGAYEWQPLVDELFKDRFQE